MEPKRTLAYATGMAYIQNPLLATKACSIFVTPISRNIATHNIKLLIGVRELVR